jgi:5-methylcytosine-specific restriction endonuclease McrA
LQFAQPGPPELASLMTDYIPVSLSQLVIQRASGACEYCLIHQTFSIYSHEVDHAIALKYGGQTSAENLVLACLPCNRHKGLYPDLPGKMSNK